jgi:hypothetical protein
VEFYTVAANCGLAAAQYNLGTLYAQGVGVGGDITKAKFWLAKAAEQGHKFASRNLAILSGNAA